MLELHIPSSHNSVFIVMVDFWKKYFPSEFLPSSIFREDGGLWDSDDVLPACMSQTDCFLSNSQMHPSLLRITGKLTCQLFGSAVMNLHKVGLWEFLFRFDWRFYLCVIWQFHFKWIIKWRRNQTKVNMWPSNKQGRSGQRAIWTFFVLISQVDVEECFPVMFAFLSLLKQN